MRLPPEDVVACPRSARITITITDVFVIQVPNRRDCEELCLSETGFICLSADYNIVTLSCALR